MRLLKLDKELCRATFEKFVQLGYPLHNEAWEHLGVGLYQNIKDRTVQCICYRNNRFM